jgi:predicted metal-dependent hydrolase
VREEPTNTLGFDTLVIDDLRFTVRRSARRATIGITVERDGSLTLSAPPACSHLQLEQTARDKRFWIYTKLAEKQALTVPPPHKEFVTGEGFWYLGRSYRLRVLPTVAPDTASKACTTGLRLHQGRFLLSQAEAPRARDTFVRWYSERASIRLIPFVQDLSARIDVQPQLVRVRDLGHRWGSCGHTNTLNFHWRAILLPPRIVEYIVAHELVHLNVPHHDSRFWRRLERTLPDYAARKYWLAEHGGRYTL